ncbi:benzoate/H(+) symporter BenE family transporter [Nocardioides currus]|uniref:Benzoate transporter n=1 Tax=Nocardioides currus TaxID=2133958 RepID=A0A2R7YTA8_9ACTN|nr:benzoate/H(+) symporter BenE family transporter [Nocardioides currus]PUA79286.1 benzoate transporter [Nocardioides currus]
MSAAPRDSSTSHAVAAGVVTALVGFTSSFAVVLTGLRAVGADQAQAASGLAVVSVTMGLGCIVLSLVHRTPVTVAWSTPGAALLAGAAVPAAGWAGAVGAFVVAGLLYLLTAAVKPLGEWVARIPKAIASAMLAGVLLTLCVEPFRALASDPRAIAPVLVTWLVLLRLARRWAVPGALLVAGVVIAVAGEPLGDGSLLPALTWTMPDFDWRTTIALGLSLYLVTMTGQNIPGVAVLESFGYRAPLRSALTWAGASTVLTGPAGGFSINLAAISAALAAGPEAGDDRDRRWVAGVTCGVVYVLLAPLSVLVTTISAAAPDGIIASVAGVALIGTFASSASAALSDTDHREAGAITFLVAASGLSFAGISPAFWALVAGGVVLITLRLRVR